MTDLVNFDSYPVEGLDSFMTKSMFPKRYSCKTEVFGEVMDGLNVQFLSNIRIGLVNKRIMGIALLENYEVCYYNIGGEIALKRRKDATIWYWRVFFCQNH
jgi:hypothetical protein